MLSWSFIANWNQAIVIINNLLLLTLFNNTLHRIVSQRNHSCKLQISTVLF